MTNNLEDEIREVLAHMESGENEQEPKTETPGNEATDEIQDIYVLVVREREEEEAQAQVVDSTPTVTPQPAPVATQQDSFISAYIFLCFSLFLLFSTLAFQLFCIVNPPVATITIIPKSQQVTLSGTLQLGRLLQPITISQSQTIPTTGKGHQDARNATGYITFYNGELNTVTIAAGTILTSAQGVQIATEQDATIPPADPTANPPAFGNVTVSAHAVSTGARGNIPAYDISQACCFASVIAKNTAAFHNGQDERDFQTVAQADVTTIASALKSSLSISMQGALKAQAKLNETVITLPCNPIFTPDHRIGEEATQVKVSVSESCAGIAFNTQALATKAASLLTSQALNKLGSGYSLLGDTQVSVKQANVSHTSHPLVFLSFSTQGTWVYAISNTEQQRIKSTIAGKTKQEAARLLAALPGIEQASIRWGDDTKLPKHTESIRVVVMYGI